MKCLLDLDGVLVDFLRGALELFGVPDPYLNPENHGKCGIETMIGIPPERFYGAMGEAFWANLKPTREFEAILQLVEGTFGAKNVCILTAPVNTHGCLEGKRWWINNYLPNYRRRFLIGSPKHFCAGPESVLIDDSDANIKAFREEGGLTILYPRLWNSRHLFNGIGIHHLAGLLDLIASQRRTLNV